MEDFGLRELRQNASDLVRRAESGEQLLITVAGRAAAVLGPAAPRAWRRWDEVSDAFRMPIDETAWEADSRLLDDAPTDPWDQG